MVRVIIFDLVKDRNNCKYLLIVVMFEVIGVCYLESYL